jgi:hypothetical protein
MDGYKKIADFYVFLIPGNLQFSDVYVILFAVIAGNAILGTRSYTGQPFNVVHGGGGDDDNGVPVPA